MPSKPYLALLKLIQLFYVLKVLFKPGHLGYWMSLNELSQSNASSFPSPRKTLKVIIEIATVICYQWSRETSYLNHPHTDANQEQFLIYQQAFKAKLFYSRKGNNRKIYMLSVLPVNCKSFYTL